MANLAFFAQGEPVPYDRAAARGRFTPARNEVWRSMVAVCFLLVRQQTPGAPAIGEHRGGVALQLDFHGANPCADLDNLAKEVMDGLNGVAWHDDRQVVDLRVCRLPLHEEHGQGVAVYVTWLAPDAPAWLALYPPKAPRKRRTTRVV